MITKSSDKEILLSSSPLHDTVVPRCMSDSDCSSCCEQSHLGVYAMFLSPQVMSLLFGFIFFKQCFFALC